MSWQGRWREMVLAGGAVAVAACGNGQVASSGDASGDATSNGFVNGACPTCNSVTDPCIANPASCGLGPDLGPADAGGDALVDSPLDPLEASCCNANENPDPCCAYRYCEGSLTHECSAELACQAEGGTYTTLVDGVILYLGCSFEGGAVDVSARDAPADGPTIDSAADAPPTDAPADAGPDVVYNPFCCNANPDPCCEYLYCGAPLTSACIPELACQADGGTYDPYGYVQSDGSIVNGGCTFPSEGGPDATPDSEPTDAGGG